MWGLNVRRFLLLAVALAVLFAGVRYLKTTERKENARVRALYASVEPLERERTSLQKELRELDGNYGLKMRDYGTIEILFPVLDERIMSQAYPVMRDNEVVGVLCLSANELPDSREKLSLADTKRLLNDGWGTCLIYDNDGHSFSSWYSRVARYLGKKELPVPTSIYFPEGSYDDALVGELKSCGITTVIRDVVSGRTDTVSDPTRAIWYTGAMPWNYTGFSTDVELLGRTNGANLCFILRFAGDWESASNRADPAGQRQKEEFVQILSEWSPMIYAESPLDELEKLDIDRQLIQSNSEMSEAVQELYYNSLTPEQLLLLPRFRVVTLETARSSHKEAVEHNQAMERELAQKQQELEERLAELDQQIRSKYDEFSKTDN